MSETEPLLTYAEAAKLIGCPVGTLYAWVHRKTIPHIRVSGRFVRFSRTEINAWIAERRVPVQNKEVA